MRWVYRLQQRVAITRTESNVILGLAVLFLLGLAFRYVQSRPRPLPDAVYDGAMQQFEQASAAEAAGREPAAPAADSADSSPVEAAAPAAVNLNTATAAQLQRLPRIGPALAARIIAYREEHGSFRRVQDLTRVRGIGRKTLDRLEPLLFVEGEGRPER